MNPSHLSVSERKKPLLDPILWCTLAIYLCLSFTLHHSAHLGKWSATFKQCINLSIALSAMLVASLMNQETLRRFGVGLYGMTIILLVCVLAFGHTGKGAQRWLDLKWIRFEPSEIMKLALPITLANFLDHQQCRLNLYNSLVCAVLIIIPFLLIAKQPDLGTASLIVMIGIQVMMMAGLKLRVLLYAALSIAATSPLSWRYLLHDYQKKRILTLLFPKHDLSGSGYHILQAKIAIGSGGWFGKGWHQGTQTHLNYLPEHNTDFVFALCAEEFGLIGCLLLMGLCLTIVTRCMMMSFEGYRHFTQLCIASISFAFGLCSLINIAMVSGLIPVVGVPLPIMSYGGTTLLVTMTGFGIINACRRSERPRI